MNTNACAPSLPHFAASAPARRRRPFRWGWLVATLAVLASLPVIFAACLILSFRMGGEARALRQAVVASDPDHWRTEFELGVGRLPAWVARNGLRAAAGHLELPPEALAGIASFRAADVGVYRRTSGTGLSLATPPAKDIDAVMARRGWEPVVTVHERDQYVRVFVPEKLDATRELRACVLVLQEDQMVLVSALLDPEPLVGLAHCRWPRGLD